MTQARESGNTEVQDGPETQIPEWPCCLKWGTLIPSIDGPFGPGWAAHNDCPRAQHGWFRYRKEES